MADIANDAECQRGGCGHMGSAHGDTADGDNTGACSMQGCECSAMMPSDDDQTDDGDGDASSRRTGLSVAELAERLAPGDAKFATELRDSLLKSGHLIVPVDYSATTTEPDAFFDEIVRAMTAPLDAFGAVGVHHTPTTDAAWDAGAQEKKLDDPSEAEIRRMYAWVPDDGEVTKTSAKFPHHMVDGDGNVAAANVKACQSILSVLNGGMGGADIPDGDKDGVWAHAVAHLKDSGVDEADLPEKKFSGLDVVPIVVRGATSMAKLSANACFRTGCTHMSGKHLDLMEGLGLGKCTVNGCICKAFMPEGSPGEPALPEPGVTAAATDGEPGAPGGEPEEDVDGPGPDNDGFPFRALLVQEGIETSDGRFIEPMATKWRTPPLSLAYQDKTEHGGFADTAAINIGRIDTITREPGATEGTYDIFGVGVIDDDDPAAVMAAHKIEGQFLKGVSVDLAIHAADIEITAADEDGWPIGERLIVTDCEIGMATVTSFPAFGDCQIELTGPGPSDVESETGFDLPEVGDRIPVIADSFTWHMAEPEHVEERAAMTVLASGGPMVPPREWFAQPSFAADMLVEIPPALCGGRRGIRACPLTIGDDGRVFGHLASWHVNHTAMSGKSIRAPRNAGYDLFNNRGVVRVDDGTDLPVGTITLDGGHADLRLDWKAAIAHYDDTRSAVIDCRVGADEYGVWIAGALRPDVDDLTLRRLKAATVSGDWRPFGGRHELIAACSTNTAGFPTMRAAIAASGSTGDGELVALVAAGALPTPYEPDATGLLKQATEELAHLRRQRDAERLMRTIG